MSVTSPEVKSAQAVADLIGVAAPLDRLPARSFEPWHRPRKQYVRRYQWCEAMRDIAIQVNNDGGEEFRYLTLPGQDMLDIRFLHDELFEPLGLMLRFLAFDHGAAKGSAEEITANSSLHAVKHLPFVDVEGSRLHSEAIERIASERSAAHDALRAFGSFHAINIDLCDGVAKRAGCINNPNVFDVLNKLLEAQCRTQHDCVIFLTTRVDSAQVDDGVRESLRGLVGRNLEQCEEFARAMSAHLVHEDGLFTYEQYERLSDEDQFIIGLLKWLCHQSVEHRLSFELKSMSTYKQNPFASADDLASIVLKVTPNREPAADPTGVAVGVAYLTDEQWECNYSSKMPRVISRTTRVDDLLRDNEHVFAECRQETLCLLSSASYDTSGYDEFIAGSETLRSAGGQFAV